MREAAAEYGHDYYSQRDFSHWTIETLPATPSMPLVDPGTPIEFRIQANEWAYLDPREIFLHTESSLLDGEGNVLSGDKNVHFDVAPINFFSNTQWAQVEVLFNNTLVNSCKLFPYLAYIPTLLYSTEVAQSGAMRSGLWYKDKSSLMDNMDQMINTAFKQRSVKLLLNRQMELDAPLLCDVLKIPTLIPPKVEVTIRLYRAEPEFCLLSGAEDPAYQLRLEKAELRYKRLFPCMNAPGRSSLGSGLKIPYVKLEAATFLINSDVTSFNQTILRGDIPRRVYIVMMEQAAFDGSYAKNPFRFRNYNLRSIQMDINGRVNPAQPLEVDFKGRYYQLYNFFLSNIGVRWELDYPNISLEEYKAGFTIFAFNTVASSQVIPPRVKKEQGYMKLALGFNTAPANPVTLMCVYEHEKTIIFDKFMNPTVE